MSSHKPAEKIKICHMTSVHKREDGRIFKRECVSLQEAGYEVYLVVADDKPDEIKNGVHICSVNIKPQNRVERMTKAAKCVFRKALEINAQVYHFHDPELMPYGYKLKKMGKKVIFDSHEDTAIQILDKKYLIAPKIASKIFKFYQNYIIKRLDAVIIVTPNFTEKFKGAEKRVYVITNYPELMPVPDRTEIKRQVCFTGSCFPEWCNVETAEAVSELNCEYLIAGTGDKSFIDEVIAKGKGKTKYLGQISRDEAFRIQTESVAGMVVSRASQEILNGGSLGVTKLFEYMMNGLPVICSNVRLWREVVEQYECGICVDPFDIHSIREGIEYMLMDPDRARKMGNNGRKAVEERFNWKTQKEELLRIYRKVLKDSDYK